MDMDNEETDASTSQAPLPLWQMIGLLILFAFVVVALFGLLVYLFTSGARLLGFPPEAWIVIFMLLSGVFAWLLKRVTDVVAGMSTLWFPEPPEEAEREP
jgi:hypothetical protein